MENLRNKIKYITYLCIMIAINSKPYFLLLAITQIWCLIFKYSSYTMSRLTNIIILKTIIETTN